MGEQRVNGIAGAERTHHTNAILRDLLALERMLAAGAIETGVRRLGVEQELFLVDPDGRPAPIAMRVLEGLPDERFTTELGLFNLEINLDPLELGSNCFSRLEQTISEAIGQVRAAAERLDAGVYLGGTLPTLKKSDLHTGNMTPRPRYAALDAALTRALGGPHVLQIKGVDEICVMHDSAMLEAACTSYQVHLQVDAVEFARLYNLAQAVLAPVLAAATNSPLLFGRRLWQETRIPVFQQAIDTRHASFHLRERKPRVSFGHCWVDESVLELFREGIARFRHLLTGNTPADPLAALRCGEIPELEALRVHNGTVYRWNRACYGTTAGVPHLRIEARALPAGPTVRDEVANTAFFIGSVLGAAAEVDDIRERMLFADARTNFIAAAESGLGAQLTWVDGRRIPATRLILERLLPVATKGLLDAGVEQDDVRRYLGVIEKRVESGQTGSRWALKSIAAAPPTATRHEVVTSLTAATLKRQQNGSPVHEWPLANIHGERDMATSDLCVEDFMTTDVFAVAPEESLALTGHVMDWNRVRHVPVEDSRGRLVGLLSSLDVISHLARRFVDDGDDIDREVTVGELMSRDPVTVGPQTTIRGAIEIMHRERVECLPVVEDGELVGIVTEHDFVQLVARLLDTVEN